jgi:hypothetical protein
MVFPELSPLFFFKACLNGQSQVIGKIFKLLLTSSFESVEVATEEILNLMKLELPIIVYDGCGELQALELDPQGDQNFSLWETLVHGMTGCRDLNVYQVICRTNIG